MTAAEKHQVSRRGASRAGGRRGGRAGIRDVAAAAGVSITTVSDALNGKGRLPDATRRHVRDVAERLGYRPSAAARALRTGKSGLIGLTVTTYGEEPFTFTEFAYFAEMARAATSAALARGYALVILPAGSRNSAFDVWSNVALDGTVVIDPSEGDPVVTELVRSGIPVVSDGRPAPSLPVAGWVDNDHEAAVRDLLDHLAASGARRIGLLTGTSTDTYTRLSTRAYHDWCTRVGQEPVVEAYPAHDPCAGAVAADRLLGRPDRPDAVYGLFDPNGTDLLAAAHRYGLRVPEDLLLVCCSESAVYSATDPPVTTLSLRPDRIGTTVIQLLIDAIEGTAPPGPVEHVMPTDLLVRASSRRRPPRTTVSPPRTPPAD
jgi:DNA-binding LacI/PurR family transcriptional regulator